MISPTSPLLPWILVVGLVGALYLVERRERTCPAPPAVATAATSTATATTERRDRLTVTLPPSSKPTTIVVESSSAVTASAVATTRMVQAVAKKNWSLGLSTRLRPSLSARPTIAAYGIDIAGRVGGTALFVVVGTEREEDTKRWNVSLGVRYEF